MQGIIVVGHGSKSSHALEVLSSVGSALSDVYGRVSVASMQFNRPTIEEAVEEQIAGGVKDIVIAPFFLYSGNHVVMDIPDELDVIQEKYPDIKFRMTESLGFDPRVLAVLKDRIDAALASSNGNGHHAVNGDVQGVIMPPEEIEARSMEILRKLLPDLPYQGVELEMVERVVHTTGDPGIAGQVLVSPGAGAAGIAAVKAGAPILTDVTMVRAGLHRQRLGELGCEIHCLIDDPGVIAAAKQARRTRSATAMRALRSRMDDAIIVIGNAPTALLEVIEIMAEGVRPALVIGAPVGFVGAAESKELLIRLAKTTPYVTVTGARGGSPVAAAIVNAILPHC